MKQQYNTKARAGINILNLLGFALAVIFTVGFFKKTAQNDNNERSYVNYEKEEKALRSGIAEFYPAEAKILPARSSASKKVRSYATSEKIEKERRASPSNKAISIEDWIYSFEGFAKDQAIKNGVPAGISLAMGINVLENGVPIRSEADYIRLVVEPLRHLKTNAPYKDRSAYFKYAANSKKWADGLGASGRYSSSDLRKVIRQYRLDVFDRAVRDYIVGAASDSPALERKIEYVAQEAREQKIVNRTASTSARPALSRSERVAEWTNNYQDVVGQEVAKEVARKKLKTGSYITEEDMKQLIEETNAATDRAMENKLMFLGRRINREHKDASKVSDLTRAENAQARGERYQEYVKSKRKQ
ncbi:MAG: hypothetical protein AAF849_24135 [Bacteroidota bacterium]